MADDHQHSSDRFNCPNCGASLQAGLADQFFCEYCGSPLPGFEAERKQQDPTSEADLLDWLQAAPSAQRDPPTAPAPLPATGRAVPGSRSFLVYGVWGIVLTVVVCAVAWAGLLVLSSLIGNLFNSDPKSGTPRTSSASSDAPPPPSDASAASDLIFNGDFSGLEGWQVQPSTKCTHCGMESQRSDKNHSYYLAWERTGSGADGAALWARQRPTCDVRRCGKLVLSFDVRVDHHSLPNSGWWSDGRGGSGEYPAKVVIAFTDNKGERFEWAHGFLYRHDGSTRLVNYTRVPKGQWVHFETDLFAAENWVDGWGMSLPSPVTLTDIFVGGNGWDFAGALTNLQLSGCQ